MAELKTKKTSASVQDFLKSIGEPERERDCRQVLRIMQKVTGEKPVMWGPSIVGFGQYQYKYGSGRHAEWFLTGFSPRKANLTLYLMAGFEGYPELMRKLGKHKTGRSCLYIKTLEDIDTSVLEQLVRASVENTREMWK